MSARVPQSLSVCCSLRHEPIVHQEGDCPLCKALGRLKQAEMDYWDQVARFEALRESKRLDCERQGVAI